MNKRMKKNFLSKIKLKHILIIISILLIIYYFYSNKETFSIGGQDPQSPVFNLEETTPQGIVINCGSQHYTTNKSCDIFGVFSDGDVYDNKSDYTYDATPGTFHLTSTTRNASQEKVEINCQKKAGTTTYECNYTLTDKDNKVTMDNTFSGMFIPKIKSTSGLGRNIEKPVTITWDNF